MSDEQQRPSFVELKIRSFEGQIMYFNGMYKLPVAPYPSVGYIHESLWSRLEGFRETLYAEVMEVNDILASIKSGMHIKQGKVLLDENGNNIPYRDLDTLVDLADWLGDITIYCASEAAKFGLPMKEILRIIMQSNFSKLQADGTVKYDANGKVEKGPGYWKPEPLLRDLLEDAIKEHAKGQENKNGHAAS